MADEIVTQRIDEGGKKAMDEALESHMERLFQKLGSTTFPWLKDLPENERMDFFRELYAALDNTRYGVPNPRALDYVKAVDEVAVPWRYSAQAMADGTADIIASATEGDFGEVPPPYKPRYELHSIICEKVQPGRYGERFRVMGVKGADYVLRPLYSGGHTDLMLWEIKDCDKHTWLEWLDDAPRYGRKAHGKGSRLLTPEEAKTMEGWPHGQ